VRGASLSCVESVAFRAHYPPYCVGGCSLAQFNSSYPLHLVADLDLQSLNLVKQTLCTQMAPKHSGRLMENGPVADPGISSMFSANWTWVSVPDHGCAECVVGLLAGGAQGVQSDAGAEDEHHGEWSPFHLQPKVADEMGSQGSVVAPAGERALFNVVPILTVSFLPGNATGSIARSEVQLTCMKPIDLSVKSQSTMVGNDQDVGRSSAGRVRL